MTTFKRADAVQVGDRIVFLGKVRTITAIETKDVASGCVALKWTATTRASGRQFASGSYWRKSAPVRVEA